MLIVDCISYYIKNRSKKQLKNGINFEKLPIFRHLKRTFLYLESDKRIITIYRKMDKLRFLCQLKIVIFYL